MIARYRVTIPSPLRSYTRGHEEVIVTLPELSRDHGPPLRAIIAALDSSFPGIRFRMVDEQGKLRPHIAVFVGPRAVRDLATPVPPDTEVMIVAALSGG
ncbi:MAG: MoaD/ThiS family protein [Betaproteobacteria bacterium]